MKKSFTILVLFLAGSWIAGAQNTFQKTFGSTGQDQFNSVVESSNGDLVFAGGFVPPPSSTNDGFLAKLSAMGDTIWTETLHSPVSLTFSSVIKTSDDKFVCLGTYDNISGGASYLVKIDTNGSLLWSYEYTGNRIWANSIQQTADNGFILCGSDSLGYFLLKLDSLGNFIWATNYAGDNLDGGDCVHQCFDGGYIVSGSFVLYDTIFSIYSGYGELLKTDGNGNVIWHKVYSNFYGGMPVSNRSTSVIQTHDSGYAFIYEIGPSGFVSLARTNPTGNLIWQRDFLPMNFDLYFKGAVYEQPNHNLIINGYYNNLASSTWFASLLEVRENGDSAKQNLIGPANYSSSGFFSCQTSDGGFAIAGKKAPYATGFYDALAIKTDSNLFTNCFDNLNTIGLFGDTSDFAADTPIVKTNFTVTRNNLTLIVHRGVPVIAECPNQIHEIVFDNNFSLSPNPCTSSTQISFTSSENKKLTCSLYNLLGEKLKEETRIVQVGENHFTLNTENLPRGVYLLRIGNEKETEGRLLVVE